MSTPLTPTQKKAVAQLVMLRYCAKKTVKTKKILQSNITILTEIIDAAIRTGDLKAQAINKIDLDANREHLLEIDFRIIELGKAFSLVSHQCEAAQVPRESWLRALCVNESEWHTPDMLAYGESPTSVVGVLDLENSATKEDAIENKPLKWCQTMAMLNATRTNPKLGEFMHDKCNEMFDGMFGDYQPPTMLEQLGVTHA